MHYFLQNNNQGFATHGIITVATALSATPGGRSL
jgi:hypothetical protein